MPSLQDYVAALVRYVSDRPGRATVQSVVGTAFFIDAGGTFVTSRRALTDGPGTLGLALRIQGQAVPFALTPIAQHEFADTPWDVAIGRVTADTRRVFTLAEVSATSLLWERLGCYGCVGLDHDGGERGPQPMFRALVGNVQREIPAERVDTVPSFELSFPITTAMRGAPLFARDHPRSRLVGVCVGNVECGPVECPAAPPATKGSMRTDVYGVAQDIRALSGWRPRLLYGRTLREALDASS